MENKKVKLIKEKEKKIKRIKKKVLINFFYSEMERLTKAYQELLKYVKEPVGDIKANLTLTPKGKLWHITISVDGEAHVNMTSGLWMIIKMLSYYRRVYDIEELRAESEKEKKKEKKNGGN